MIYVITPLDPTLKSVTRLGYRISVRTHSHFYKIHPGDNNKNAARSHIGSLPNRSIVIFLGHGRSDALFGSKGKNWNAADFISSDARVEDENAYYNDESFIDSSCFSLFKYKILICFTCNSSTLAYSLLHEGAFSILGFDIIPSTRNEIVEQCKIAQPSSHLIAAVNGYINMAMLQCLELSYSRKLEIGEIEQLLKTEFQLAIMRVLSSKAHYRYQLASILTVIRKGIRVVGDRKKRFQ